MRLASHDETLLGIYCPYCIGLLGLLPGYARSAAPTHCPHCGETQGRDAKLELRTDAWSALERQPCPSCRQAVPTLATRCAHCKAPCGARSATPMGASVTLTARGTLLAQQGPLVALSDGRSLRVYDFRSIPPRELVSVASPPMGARVALSRSGHLAVAVRKTLDVTPLAGGPPLTVALPSNLSPKAIDVLGSELWVLPTSASDLTPFVPWRFSGAWEPVSGLPSATGWDDDAFGWSYDGCALEAQGATYVFWNERLYREDRGAFTDLGVGPLPRFYSEPSAIAFANGILAATKDGLHFIALDDRPTARVVPGWALVRRLCAANANDGSILVEFFLDDAGARRPPEILWPSGERTVLQPQKALGQWHPNATVFVAGDALVVIDDDQRGRDTVAFPWSTIAALPRTPTAPRG